MIRIISIFLTFCLAGSLSAQETAPAGFDVFNDKLDDALIGLKMVRSDLSLRDDYIEKDTYRLKLIDSLMNAPLEMINLSQNLLDGDVPGYADHLGVNFEQLAFPDRNPEPHVKKYFKPKKVDKLTLHRIDFFLSRIEQITELEIFDEQNAGLLDSLAYGFMLMFEEDVEDEFRTAEQRDSIQQYEEEWADVLKDIAGSVNLESIGLAGQAFLDVFSDFIINDEFDIQLKSDYVEFKTAFGKVCVGDTSAQHYSGDLFIVIDYGGDDIYDIHKAVTGNFTFILDYGGNDTYNLPKARINPYSFGANVLVDFNGDDLYNASSWGLGAGLLGTGILWDKKGNDKYFGDTFTMGAGCFGYGLLRDDGGDDFYNAALRSQGFGSVKGVGVLIDSLGNDHYFAGGKYRDIFHFKGHNMSLSQGFATGIRPYMSGGAGYLIDKSGNDTYESDVFGQGCSYWWSLGVLADGGGNDKYLSYLYAQGSATHMSLGCLYDRSGDDFYLAHGVSQGCGHDYAAGILYNASGNDDYVGYDLSQGAGSANGIGIIADLEGIDSYLVKKADNTQGYGNPRRDYGSIGIFLDIGGAKDSYAGGPGTDSTWWSGSKWGIGIDE